MKKIFGLLAFSMSLIPLFSCSKNKDDNDNKEEINNSIADGYFASVNGTTAGDGSYNSPWDIKTAMKNVSSNKPLYIKGGVYNVSSFIMTNSGTNDKKIIIKAYNNEDVIFDYGHKYDKNVNVSTVMYNKESYKGIVIKGDYYHISGIKIMGAGSSGIQVAGNYNIIENCVLAYNGNSGLQISSPSSLSNDKWAHDNLILNCTSYASYDWARTDGNQGEDADGFACKLTAGVNNVFDGCIAYNNSDDGWDLFTKRATGPIGAVTLRNCIAFSNGIYVDGTDLKNGNGFKMGGRALEVNHTITNSIAFDNKANGFDDNSNPGCIEAANCTAYNNGKGNFAMGRFVNETNTYTSVWTENGVAYGPISGIPMSHNSFTNCVSYKSGVKDTYIGVAANCIFNSGSNYYKISSNTPISTHYVNLPGTKITSFANPFVSVTSSKLDDLDNIHKAFRNADGTINLGDYLKTNGLIGANLH